MISDPNILVSAVNMKLRDGSYESLSDLCRSEGLDENELVATLKSASFTYDSSVKRFY